MKYSLQAPDFETWRSQARNLLNARIPPAEVSWLQNEAFLFSAPFPSSPSSAFLPVPAAFLPLARIIACHRDEQRWNLLYQLLFRLTHGEKHLLAVMTDPLMHQLHLMEKAIRRDAHKMKAFVRFRKIEEAGEEHYIAWHEPDHYVVPLTAPFFSRRFCGMRWSILTPDACAHWDGEHLAFSAGASREQAPGEDRLESLWKDYYRATFNPARIKIAMMKREMPVRYWKNLPETDIITELLNEAPQRVEAMLKHSEGMRISAADFLPAVQNLPNLHAAAKHCEGCELHKTATQTVFGDGKPAASIMFVGEQPGDEEDRQGRPFIGPAGTLLARALEQAGLRREDAYITNAVKHFRFTQHGEARVHRGPLRQHVHACKPWLMAEIAVIKPKVIICLGNTAARALLGQGFTLKNGRGVVYPENPPVLATYHPAAILRAQGGERETMQRVFFSDIVQAVRCFA